LTNCIQPNFLWQSFNFFKFPSFLITTSQQCFFFLHRKKNQSFFVLITFFHVKKSGQIRPTSQSESTNENWFHFREEFQAKNDKLSPILPLEKVTNTFFPNILFIVSPKEKEVGKELFHLAMLRTRQKEKRNCQMINFHPFNLSFF
jgi:hypothetical protein